MHIRARMESITSSVVVGKNLIHLADRRRLVERVRKLRLPSETHSMIFTTRPEITGALNILLLLWQHRMLGKL